MNNETKPLHSLTIDELPYCTMVSELAKSPIALAMERTPEKQAMLDQVDVLAGKAERLRHCLDPLKCHHEVAGTFDSIRHGQWLHWEHMTFAFAGEAAGELRDAVKRHVIYGVDLDAPGKNGGPTLRENIKEEAGDCAFYIEGARQFLFTEEYRYFWDTIQAPEHERQAAYTWLLGVTNELNALMRLTVPGYTMLDAQHDNKVKLWEKRYKGGKYSDAAAVARADKAPGT